jgi:hypothetical protein
MQGLIERIREAHAGMDCGLLLVGQYYAKAKAGRPATILHALANIEEVDCLEGRELCAN